MELVEEDVFSGLGAHTQTHTHTQNQKVSTYRKSTITFYNKS